MFKTIIINIKLPLNIQPKCYISSHKNISIQKQAI